MIDGYLKSAGIRVQRHRIRESIWRIDPIAPALRWTQLILRRPYSVPGPNSLWHNDGWHALIRWKFVVHGFIDGFSRLLLGLRCSTNNRAETVMDVYRECEAKYGTPSRIRGDRGGENSVVAAYITRRNGANRGSYIFGSSVHNQRIERSWKDLWKTVGCFYYWLFASLEDQFGLNNDNATHLWCLHYIYLPRLNRSLEIYRRQWNNHKIRTEGHKSPRHLYLKGMMDRGLPQATLDDFHGLNAHIDVAELENFEIDEVRLG